MTGVILVVRAMPDARVVRKDWVDQIPELADAIVLSPHQGPGAHLGLIAPVHPMFNDLVAPHWPQVGRPAGGKPEGSGD